ncbi:MAG: DUF3891 family protein [Sphingobacteriaceae bacterium]|nr:MAG: DUF3891 family protein [Sphingobacteriaceae bacterium]
MIVNYTQAGWEIILQRAHGNLAGQLAAQWKIANRPERWTETLLAVAEHDDAQTELEQDDLVTENGGPVNFKMKTFELPHCQQMIDFSLSKSRYIALLTSMHIDFLHVKEAQQNPEAKAFLQEQENLRANWLNELKISLEEAEKTYALLEWCDAFSLLICQKLYQPEQRSIEISKGPNEQGNQLIQLDEKTLTVKPWPFEADEFTIRYDSRVISKLSFANSAEFKQCLLDAAVTENVWIVQKNQD